MSLSSSQTKFRWACGVILALGSLVSGELIYAVDKAVTGTELTDGASWIGGIAPNTTGVNNPATTSAGGARWTASSLSGALTVASPVTWDTFNITTTTALSISGSPITLAGANTGGSYSVISGNSTGTRNIANDLILTGVNSNAVVGVNSGARLEINAGTSGGLTLGNVTSMGGGLTNDANLNLRGSGVNTINGTVIVDGQLGKADNSTWILNGNNTVSWIFINNGALLAGSNGAFGTGSIYINDNANNSSPILASADGNARTFVNALEITGGFSGNTRQATFGQAAGDAGALTFSGNVNLGTAVRNITTNADTTFSGSVIGTGGGIVKAGTAALVLASNTNSFTGAVTVNEGTLLINGNVTGATAFTVNAAILGGTGNIARTVTMNTGSTLAPGASIESLAVSSVTMASGSTFAWEAANASTTGADLLVVSGALSLTDVALNLDAATLAALSGNSWNPSDKLTLINYGGTALSSGFTGYSDDSTYTFGTNSWMFNYNDGSGGSNYAAEAVGANFVTLTFVAAVPEPGMLGALLIAGGCYYAFRARRQR